MTDLTATSSKPLARVDHPLMTPSFVRGYALVGTLFIAGACVDLWAHSNIRPLFETFFTPWHALLYGGFGLIAAFLFGSAARHHARGYPWRLALPEGYGWSLIGAAVFSMGGAFDLVWHTLFGIEAGFDALVSPSHLVLVLGATLVVSGPLRAAPRRNPWRWSVALSALWTLTLLLPFFALFRGPFAIRTATGPAGPTETLVATQMLATVIYAALVVGILLVVSRSVELPLGSGLVIVGGSAAITAIIRSLDLGAARELFLIVAAVAGLLSDALLWALRPSTARPYMRRLFAAALPVVILVPYFGAIAVALPVTWSAHAMVGTVLLAGGVGVLLGIVATPEAVPALDTRVDKAAAPLERPA